MDYLFAAFTVILLAIGAPVLLYYFYNGTRRKGYRQPGAVFLVLAFWGAVFTAVYALAPQGIARSTQVVPFLLYFFWLPTLLATTFNVLLIRLIPDRSGRRYGARRVRIPFRRMGQVTVGLGSLLIAFTMLGWLARARSSADVSVIELAGFVVLLGFYWIRLGNRAQAPVLAEIAEAPDEPRAEEESPVGALYLRSFRQESQCFVIGAKDKYGAYGPSWTARTADTYGNVHLTFEQYFSETLTRNIGAFVALGSPEDYIAPEGAVRLYAKDTEWMDQLDRLARRSLCILVELGQSNNLRWEFGHLREAGLQEKLFVITRPAIQGRALSIRFAWKYRGLIWRIKGIQDVTWRQFADELVRLGYNPIREDPGPGAVVTFDRAGNSVLLTAGADLPEDFVEPIRNWVTRRQCANL